MLFTFSFGVFPFMWQDFFPAVDGGQLRLHLICPTGTRIEETERIFTSIEKSVRELIPPTELQDILDNIRIADKRSQPCLR